MSTNSTIGIRRLDGSVSRIYCHYDGYVEYNGVYLQLCYDTPEKIEELLKLGNLSSLCETVKDCVAYHREKGEQWEDATNYGEQEFNYLFDETDGVWIVTKRGYDELIGKHINIAYEYPQRTTELLIDSIMDKKENILKDWTDDEFATKDNLIEIMLENATKQVRIADNRKMHEYDDWYRTYCD